MTAMMTTKYDLRLAHDLAEVRAHLRELVVLQTAQKRLLRTPHHELKDVTVRYPRSKREYAFTTSGWRSTASALMAITTSRACLISALHEELNELRGKPRGSHQKRG